MRASQAEREARRPIRIRTERRERHLIFAATLSLVASATTPSAASAEPFTPASDSFPEATRPFSPPREARPFEPPPDAAPIKPMTPPTPSLELSGEVRADVSYDFSRDLGDKGLQGFAIGASDDASRLRFGATQGTIRLDAEQPFRVDDDGRRARFEATIEGELLRESDEAAASLILRRGSVSWIDPFVAWEASLGYGDRLFGEAIDSVPLLDVGASAGHPWFLARAATARVARGDDDDALWRRGGVRVETALEERVADRISTRARGFNFGSPATADDDYVFEIDGGVAERLDERFGTSFVEAMRSRRLRRVPSLSSRLRIHLPEGHALAASGMMTSHRPRPSEAGSRLGWGVDVGASLALTGTLRAGGGGSFGVGTARRMAHLNAESAILRRDVVVRVDRGDPLTPDDDVEEASLAATTLRLSRHYGARAVVSWRALRDVSLNAAWGESGLTRRSMRRAYLSAAATRRVTTLHVNALWRPSGSMLLGLEAIWARRTTLGGSSFDGTRLQFGARYLFGPLRLRGGDSGGL